jgi:hypothetical protein
MWNFVGRQSDKSRPLWYSRRKLVSGVTFIDELHLGSQDNLPTYLTTRVATFISFTIPLGLIGLMYHATKNMKSFMFY